MGIYAMLDRNTRRWWYFRQLRDAGNVLEARKRERESILSHVRMIREAIADKGYCTISLTGEVSLMASHKRLSGADISLAMACINAGLPVIDYRPAPYKRVAHLVVSGPMYEPGRVADDAPYHALSYAPWDVWMNLHKDIGCRIWNERS